MSRGFKVRVRFAEGSPYHRHGDSETVIENVTEIHWRYPTAMPTPRVAFESDIDNTGYTYEVAHIAEFEAITDVAETE